MTESAQTSAEERRRRPLVQYVLTRKWPEDNGFPYYLVEESAAGSKPSHWLIHPPKFVGRGDTILEARQLVPEGYKRLDRRKDDRVDVVEVWV